VKAAKNARGIQDSLIAIEKTQREKKKLARSYERSVKRRAQCRARGKGLDVIRE
jgi:hypothetical protein